MPSREVCPVVVLVFDKLINPIAEPNFKVWKLGKESAAHKAVE